MLRPLPASLSVRGSLVDDGGAGLRRRAACGAAGPAVLGSYKRHLHYLLFHSFRVLFRVRSPYGRFPISSCSKSVFVTLLLMRRPEEEEGGDDASCSSDFVSVEKSYYLIIISSDEPSS